jgi:hypothetical protein
LALGVVGDILLFPVRYADPVLTLNSSNLVVVDGCQRPGSTLPALLVLLLWYEGEYLVVDCPCLHSITNYTVLLGDACSNRAQAIIGRWFNPFFLLLIDLSTCTRRAQRVIIREPTVLVGPTREWWFVVKALYRGISARDVRVGGIK